MYPILTAALAAAAIVAPAVQAQDLTERLDQWMSQTSVNGIAVAIHDGERSETAQAGVRSEGGAEILAGDRFAVASVSKTFTAAAILRLVEAGDLSLEMRVSEASGTDFGADITISDLLYHQAGLPEYIGGSLSFGTFLEQHATGREAWLSAEVYAFATASDGASSSTFSYSNSHYAVLGLIVEHVTGQAFAEALEELVFEPAGLDSAQLVVSVDGAPDALGYSQMLAGPLGAAQFEPRLATELASLGHAAGGVALSVEDLARWSALWFSGEFVDGQGFRPSQDAAVFGLDADRISVGAGAFEVRYEDRVLRLHGGDGLGVTALAIYDPETERAVAIVQNDDAVRALGFGAEGYLDALALDLLSRAG